MLRPRWPGMDDLRAKIQAEFDRLKAEREALPRFPHYLAARFGMASMDEQYWVQWWHHRGEIEIPARDWDGAFAAHDGL